MKRQKFNNKKVKLMLDSGAYTVHRQGAEIDLNSYIKFIKDNHHLIDTYVALDVIPKDASDIERAAKESWKNYQKMRSEGLDPIPVYHYGVKRKWLDKILESGAKRIGLGAVAKRGILARESFLFDTFSYICDSTGHPIVDVHGFGVTAYDTLVKYPWTSVDSMSWVFRAVYGVAFIPPKVNGKYCYTRKPYYINMSNGNPKGKQSTAVENGSHFNTLGSKEKDYIVEYFNYLGIADVDLVKEHYFFRTMLNTRWFHEFAKSHEIRRFRNKSIFASHAGKVTEDKPSSDFQFIFGCGGGKHDNVLVSEGVTERLVSYYVVTKDPNFDLDFFIETGYYAPGTVLEPKMEEFYEKQKVIVSGMPKGD